MAKSSRLLALIAAFLLVVVLCNDPSMSVQAGSNKNYPDSLSGGVAALLDPNVTEDNLVMSATAYELNQSAGEEKPKEDTLVMVNVDSVLNVRAGVGQDTQKVGEIYKDCGGTILERQDGWTKLQSGNLIGWAKDDYLLFGEEAHNLANDVGKRIAINEAEGLRVRVEPSNEAELWGYMAKGEMMEVHSVSEDGWVSINYEGNIGYVSEEFVELDFKIATGETLDEIKARKEAEFEITRHKNFGAYETDEATKMLLAALIHCEARGESYEGQVAVGAVVMNRVRSKAYPNTIHAVIYAPYQFTPATFGIVDQVLASGKINESCIRAAEEALSGVSPVSDFTHFRTVNGREGYIIGNHVFY